MNIILFWELLAALIYDGNNVSKGAKDIGTVHV